MRVESFFLILFAWPQQTLNNKSRTLPSKRNERTPRRFESVSVFLTILRVELFLFLMLKTLRKDILSIENYHDIQQDKLEEMASSA